MTRESCIGRTCPTDAQLDGGWICVCGDGWDKHEVDIVTSGDALRFVLSRCHRCEQRAEKTVLEALIESEPLRLT